MPCYSPLQAWRPKHPNERGKWPPTFRKSEGQLDQEIKVPCGRCTGCRLEYSRQWAVRCVHEAQMHDRNSFITLTYNDKNLPEDRSIHKEELQKFFKRLRKNTGQEIRYFACGEYGGQKNRPHYHALIFGYDFPDKTLHTIHRGNPLYKSEELFESWDKGYNLIGEVTYESAAYVARYVMKKWKPDKREEEVQCDMHNAVVDRDTGEVLQLEPEFCVMSRGRKSHPNPVFHGGIGSAWWEKYKGDTEKGFITVNGKKQALPKYYDSKMEDFDYEIFENQKIAREEHFNPEDNTTERLRVKEICREAKTSNLKRILEEQ